MKRYSVFLPEGPIEVAIVWGVRVSLLRKKVGEKEDFEQLCGFECGGGGGDYASVQNYLNLLRRFDPILTNKV